MNFAVYTKMVALIVISKRVLELTGSKFVVYNLDQHFNRDAFISEFGEGSTFPQVIVDGKKIGGCVDTVRYLKENNVV